MRGRAPYLQVLPPHIDGREGQLHLLPAGVFVALVSDLYEDEEDPRRNATSHQHEYAWMREKEVTPSKQGQTTHIHPDVAWHTNTHTPRKTTGSLRHPGTGASLSIATFTIQNGC